VQSQENPRPGFLRSFDPSKYELCIDYTEDQGELVAILQAQKVDHVVAGTEYGVPLGDVLAERLGLPGNSTDTLRARRDKNEMAVLLRTAGLDAIHGDVFSSADAAMRWAKDQKLEKSVVKPLSSAGTDGVHICADVDELRAGCQELLGTTDFFGDRNDQVLVQELLEGVEFYVNTVSMAGEHKIAEVWRYCKRLGPTSTPIYDYEDAVPVDSAELAKILPYTVQVLDALEIKNGAAHSEVMLTARGPVLVETGARLGGGVLPWVSDKFSGTSHVRMLADAIQSEQTFLDFPDREIRWNGHVRNVAMISSRSGMVVSDSWRKQIESLETFVGLHARISTGKPIAQTTDLVSSPGFVYLADTDYGRLSRDYEQIRTWENDGIYLA
jgi:biotin carboxylase